jgi:hypothetical protein
MRGNFAPEAFKRVLTAYLVKWCITFVILMVLGCIPFALKGKYFSETHWFGIPLVNIFASPSYPSWHQFSIAIFAIGSKSIGFLACGSIAIGFFAVGAFSIGIVSIGAFGVGIFAFGGGSFGIIAIGTASAGIIAVGTRATGFYSLSEHGWGKYVFSLQRQDTKAVTFFTRWFPKLKAAFSPGS